MAREAANAIRRQLSGLETGEVLVADFKATEAELRAGLAKAIDELTLKTIYFKGELSGWESDSVKQLRTQIEAMGRDLVDGKLTVSQFREQVAAIRLDPETPEKIIRLVDNLRDASGEARKLEAGLRGASDPLPIRYRLPVASAQIKSAVLLAGLGARGETVVIEPEPCRDHTERMLAAFGTPPQIKEVGGMREIRVAGGAALTPASIMVPGDPSSAAFIVAAALITPGSDVTVRGVLTNPLRTGFFDTLIEMGARLEFENRRTVNGEPVADLRARHSALRGVETPSERAPSMIDEYPALAVVAAFAEGESVLRGLAELRVKESDRLAAIEAGLAANGVAVETGEDWIKITGGGAPAGGGLVLTHADHRIAMSFLVMGLAARRPVEIDDASMIATSFPGFFGLMNRIGADIASS